MPSGLTDSVLASLRRCDNRTFAHSGCGRGDGLLLQGQLEGAWPLGPWVTLHVAGVLMLPRTLGPSPVHAIGGRRAVALWPGLQVMYPGWETMEPQIQEAGKAWQSRGGKGAAFQGLCVLSHLKHACSRPERNNIESNADC